jgi:16S rRNA processing protein RimM
MATAPQRYETLVGTIVGAHGIQGATKVKMATGTALSMIMPAKRPSDQDPRPTVEAWVGKSPDDGRLLNIVSAKKQEPKELYLVRFVEATDRTAAESLYGLQIFMPTEKRKPLDKDEFFVEDLIGVQAVTEAGDQLGKITQVLQNPANDVYETDKGILIPAVKAFIVSVDIAAKLIVVRDIPGLRPEEQEAVGENGDGSDEDDDDGDDLEAAEASAATGEAGADMAESELTGTAPSTAVAKLGVRRFGGKR